MHEGRGIRDLFSAVVRKKCFLVVAALPERGPESAPLYRYIPKRHRLARYCKDRQRLCDENVRLEEEAIVSSRKRRREDRRRR